MIFGCRIRASEMFTEGLFSTTANVYTYSVTIRVY